MQTQTTFSTQAASDRETFSNQTLLLTALTAINNPSSHPSLNDSEVNKERLHLMKEKAARTRIIDAATTILVTDTEILATMARRTHTTNIIFALTEIRQEDRAEHERFASKIKNIHSKTYSLLKNTHIKDATQRHQHSNSFLSSTISSPNHLST
jgi:hypothetical protein